MDPRLKKIAKGNRKAQSKLYDEFSPMVMGICIRYLKNKDEASDVFQEAFIKVYRNIHQVKDWDTLPGWIRRVVVNTALDHIRITRCDEGLEKESHELSDQFYSALLDKMSMDTIVDLIDTLPNGCRTVFNMHIIDGYNHREIAETLKISESTSRSQLTHARKLLKKQLNDLGITRYEQVI